MSDRTRKDYPELGYSVIASTRSNKTAVDFSVYKIIGTTFNGELLFEQLTLDGSVTPIKNIDWACAFLSGFIDWEGISEWTTELLYFGDSSEAENLGKVLAIAYELAEELLTAHNN